MVVLLAGEFYQIHDKTGWTGIKRWHFTTIGPDSDAVSFRNFSIDSGVTSLIETRPSSSATNCACSVEPPRRMPTQKVYFATQSICLGRVVIVECREESVVPWTSIDLKKVCSGWLPMPPALATTEMTQASLSRHVLATHDDCA